MKKLIFQDLTPLCEDLTPLCVCVLCVCLGDIT